MYISLDGCDHDLAFGLGGDAGQLFVQAFFFFDVGNQMSHSLLHHARRFDHLRQEHLALAEQVADDVHAIHQRAFDHMDRPAAIAEQFLPRFFGIFHDPLRDALHQRVRQPLLNRAATPFQCCFFFLVASLQGGSDFDHAFGGIFAAIQYNVFDPLAQFSRQVVVHAHHAGVDDTHRHAGFDRVIQEHGVDCFTRRIVAAEAETDVGDAAADLGVRQVLANPASGVDEIDCVIVVFFDTGRNRENVRIENDVFRREADLINQQPVGALANFDLALVGIGLALFIEGHDDHGRAVAAA